MKMHLVIVFFFILTAFFAFIEDRLKSSNKVLILAFYVFFMVLIATTKSIEHTADALAYESMFYNNDSSLLEITTEPTFIYISRLVLLLGGTLSVLFFLYAIISIPLKIITFNKLTPYIFTSLLTYIPIYYELHDLIQIRAGAAVAFLVSSIIPITKKKYLIATLLICIGALFHYSAIIFLPALLIGNKLLTASWRKAIMCILPLFILMFFLKKDFFSLIPSSILQGKMEYYKEATEKGDWAGDFSPFYMLYIWIKCIVLYIILCFYDYIIARNKFAPIIITLFTASIFLLLSFSTFPVIAGRLSELYGIIDCIAFSYLLYIIRPYYLVRIAISLTGLYMILYSMFFTEYFT